MLVDIRAVAAQYDDLNLTIPDDLSFCKALIPSPDASVLELGCGTSRVLLPLVDVCGYVHGIDRSVGMLALCRKKPKAAAIPPANARLDVGDITNFDLGHTFDLIIAPYRVFQLLDTDAAVGGLFRCVRTHLAPGGDRCPQRGSSAARSQALTSGMVHQGGELADEAVLKIPRRCYDSNTFEQLVLDRGFTVIEHWGGYAGAAPRHPHAGHESSGSAWDPPDPSHRRPDEWAHRRRRHAVLPRPLPHHLRCGRDRRQPLAAARGGLPSAPRLPVVG
jgi:SAM-dependent methyltransferase